MVSLKGIGGIVLGAYVLLNPNVALSDDINDLAHKIKKCYENEPNAKNLAQKNIKQRGCARRVIQAYADNDDKIGDKNGIVTYSEIHLVLSNLKDLFETNPKLEENVKTLYPNHFKENGEFKGDNDDIKPVITELEIEIEPLPPATSEVKFNVEYESGSKGAKLIIDGDEKFEFLDAGNDEKFDRDDDCISKDDLKVCGKNLENVIALVGGEETTHEDYFKEVKNMIVKAFADYLLDVIDDKAIYFPKNESRDYESLHFEYGKYYFIVEDHGDDGITDTFYVKEIGQEFFIRITNDDSKGMEKIIGGLLPNAKAKAKK